MTRQWSRKQERETRAQVLAVMNFKGGTGKSTSVEILSDFFDRKSSDGVLLVDFDPQANLTESLPIDETVTKNNIAKALQETQYKGRYVWDPKQAMHAVYSVKVKGSREVFLIPGSRELQTVFTRAASNVEPGMLTRLRDVTNVLRPYFSYIMIDTAPAITGTGGQFVFEAADVILIPVSDWRSLFGLLQVLKYVRHYSRDANRHAQVFIYAPHVSPDRTIAAKGSSDAQVPWYDWLRHNFPDHFVPHTVRHSVYLERAFEASVASQELKNEPRAQYQAMAADLRAKLSDMSIPRMCDLLVSGQVDIEALEESLDALRLRQRPSETVPVKFSLFPRSA